MSGVAFYKMTGSANDFVMLDGRTTEHSLWPRERIAAICDRRNGIGGDGLVIVDPAGPGAARMTYWNSDGSPAPMCGNAALCSTRLSARLGITLPEGMTLVTEAGAFPTRCVGDGWLAELNLPDTDVPRLLDIPLGPGERSIRLGTVGVPHLACEVDDVGAVDVAGRGRELRFHPAIGAGGANANFYGRTSRSSGTGGAGPEWAVRTYERGVEGETLACGTGTVTSALALAASGGATLPIEFETASGRVLRVSARIEGGRAREIWLAGEGRVVAEGVWLGSV